MVQQLRSSLLGITSVVLFITLIYLAIPIEKLGSSLWQMAVIVVVVLLFSGFLSRAGKPSPKLVGNQEVADNESMTDDDSSIRRRRRAKSR